MKVGGTKGTNATNKTKKSTSSDANADVDFSTYVQGASAGAEGVSATQSIAQLDALLAVQEAGDATQKQAKKRMQARAHNILDKLETIRLRMLGGNLTVGHMVDVADVIAAHREKIDDPKLVAIMDEIDLRAQVELAKMRAALDQKA